MTFTEIINAPIAVNCTTEADADEFLKMCEDAGFIWLSGIKPTEHNFWDVYMGRTCYDIQEAKVTYCKAQYYASISYQIINFKDLEK